MTAWLYEYAKTHMSNHGRVYSTYQLDIGARAFKRAFVTHRNAVTTAVKRIFRMSERDGREKEEMLKEDLQSRGRRRWSIDRMAEKQDAKRNEIRRIQKF